MKTGNIKLLIFMRIILIVTMQRYNAGDIPELPCSDGSTGAPCKRSIQDKNVLYENKLLGVARIRQVTLGTNVNWYPVKS